MYLILDVDFMYETSGSYIFTFPSIFNLRFPALKIFNCYTNPFNSQFIENLEKLKKLEVLNLSCNMIEKIEKLDRLGKLRDLNLAYNNIIKIEGLENLINLQVLNVTGNLIQHIPIWIGKRLKSLRSFHIGRNHLQSVRLCYCKILQPWWL